MKYGCQTYLILLALVIHLPLVLPREERSACLIEGMCSSVVAQESTAALPEYTIRQTASPIDVDGRLDEPAWQGAVPVDDFIFPWWVEGEKEPTTARILWDETYLYVSFIAYDKHIAAALTQRDDPVSRDDAVEVFIAPQKDDVRQYFNFEFNALGTILDRSPHNKRSKNWNAEGIVVAITIDGTINEDGDDDRLWIAEFAIPFANFEGFAPRLPPDDGDTWRLNLYRIGGNTNPQYSVWSNTLTEKPQYHVPERFGIVHFSAVAAGITATAEKSWGDIKKPILSQTD